MVTYEELKKQVSYNPHTGIFRWKVSNSNRVKIGDIAGSIDKDGYLEIRINGHLYRAHRLAWLYYYGYMPEGLIEHRNRIKHNNWILNLRQASQQCNMRNTNLRSDNTSGVKGVSKCKRTGKWYVFITILSKHIFLGRYSDFDEAVCTRLAAEQCVNWAGCDSNSPAYQYVKNNIQEGENHVKF